MARKTPNQKQWLLSMEEIKRRLRKLEIKGVETNDIELPEQPKRYTQKSLSKLGKVRKQISQKENEYRANKVLKGRSHSAITQMHKSRVGHSRQNLKIRSGGTDQEDQQTSSNRTAKNQEQLRTDFNYDIAIPSMTDMIEKYIRDRIDDAYKKRSWTVSHLERALNDLITVHGKAKVLEKFQEGMDMGIITLDAILFGSDSEEMYHSLTDCVNYLIDEDEDVSDYVDITTLQEEVYGLGSYEI